MSKVYIFADEAGNFDFSCGPGATKYFIITTVTLPVCNIGDELLQLRRELTMDGLGEFKNGFHATSDRQQVRNRVFELLGKHRFRVDSTIITKEKVFARIRNDHAYFYQLALYLHFNRIATLVATNHHEILVVGATLQVNWKKLTLSKALESVVLQISPSNTVRTAFWPASTDPCLQVADYCCWAIQRYWERGDDRSYELIKDKIITEKLAIY